MPSKKVIIPVREIERRILLVRGQKVILDADLAQFYGVKTKRLNEQVARADDLSGFVTCQPFLRVL